MEQSQYNVSRVLVSDVTGKLAIAKGVLILSSHIPEWNIVGDRLKKKDVLDGN